MLSLRIIYIYNSHDNITNKRTSMLGDKKFLKFIFKDINFLFLFLSCGGSLFHLIVDAELNFLLSYLMQWVIGWCSIMELLLRKSLVFGLFYFVS